MHASARWPISFWYYVVDNLAKLVADLTSWYWWVTIVAVGILINIISAYLKSPLDRYFQAGSARRRAIAARRQVRFEEKVQLLTANPTLLILEAHAESRYRTQAVLLFVIATLTITVRGFIKPPGAGAEIPFAMLSGILFVTVCGLYILAMYFMRHATAARVRVEAATQRFIRQQVKQSK